MDDALKGLVAEPTADISDLAKPSKVPPASTVTPPKQLSAPPSLDSKHPVWSAFLDDLRGIANDTKDAWQQVALSDYPEAVLMQGPILGEGLGKMAVGGIAGLLGGGADAVRRVEESPPIIPQNSVSRLMQQVAAAPFKAMHAAGSAVAEKTNSPALGVVTEVALNLLVPGPKGAKIAKAMRDPKAAAGEAAVAKDPVLAAVARADKSPNPLGDLIQAGKPAAEAAPTKPVASPADLRQELSKVSGSIVADKISMWKVWNRALEKLSDTDREALHHHREDPSVPLSPEAKAAYEKVWKPIADQYHETLTSLQKEGYAVEGEIPSPAGPAPNLAVRIVKGVGGAFDWMAKGGQGGGGGKLRTGKLGSEWGRKLVALEEAPSFSLASDNAVEDAAYLSPRELERAASKAQSGGIRAQIKDGEVRLVDLHRQNDSAVIAFADGKKVGTLFYQKNHAGPANVEVASAYRRRGVASAMYDLAERVGGKFLAEDTVRSAAGVAFRAARTESGSKSKLLPTRHVAHIGDETVAAFKEGDAAELGPTSGLKSVNGQRVFESADGKRYIVKQATTKEIEAATKKADGKGVEYYKDLPTNYAWKYTELLKTKRARDLVESLKKSPLFQQLGTQDKGRAATLGWKPTALPQFRDWFFDPRIREMLDDLHGEGRKPNWMRAVDKIFIQPLFVFPQMHMRNESNLFFVERGAIGTARSLASLPAEARLAIQDVGTMSPEYMAMLRSGTNMMRASVFARKFDRQMSLMFRDRLRQDPMLKKVAMATVRAPERVLDSVMENFSNPILWGSHDVATMMSIRSKMAKGKSFEEALHETERYSVSYKQRSRLFGEDSEGMLGRLGRTMEQIGRVGGLFYRYRSDKLRAHAARIADMVTFSRNVPLKTRLQCADQLLMQGLLTYVYYPAMSAVWQGVFNNPNARLRPAGFSSDIYKLQQWLQGNAEAQDFLADVFSFGPQIEMPVELLANRNLFTGQRIYGDDERAEGLPTYLAERVPQVATVSRLARDKMTGQQALGEQVGVSIPSKKRLERERKRDERKKKQALRKESLD